MNDESFRPRASGGVPASAVWLAVSAGIGLGLGFLTLELIGLLLLPIAVPLLLRVARRRRAVAATTIAFVAGYELTIALIAGSDVVQSRSPGVDFGNPAGLIVYMVAIALIGMVILLLGLRSARCWDRPIHD